MAREKINYEFVVDDPPSKEEMDELLERIHKKLALDLIETYGKKTMTEVSKVLINEENKKVMNIGKHSSHNRVNVITHKFAPLGYNINS